MVDPEGGVGLSATLNYFLWGAGVMLAWQLQLATEMQSRSGSLLLREGKVNGLRRTKWGAAV
jgi:hypothetical protein